MAKKKQIVEETEVQETQTCPECHSLKWPIFLLGGIVILLTALVIFLTVTAGPTDSDSVVLDETDEVVDVVKEVVDVKEEMQTFAFLETIEFNYPVGWHVARNYEEIYKYIDLSPEPIIYIDGSYGAAPHSPAPVRFSTLSPAFETQAIGEADYIEQGDYMIYHTEEIIDMLSTPSEPVTYEVYTYLYTGEGEGASFSISFIGYMTETTGDNEGWETIINSLEFIEM